MPTFSNASLAQLDTCHVNLQRIAHEAIKVYDFAVIEGHRGEAKQNAAFARGDSQVTYPHGKHNATPSNAFDIMPYPVDWSGSSANHERSVFLAGIIMATAFHLGIKLRYGGDWNSNGDMRDEKFRDYGHFELV